MDPSLRKQIMESLLKLQYELANAEELHPDERLVVYGSLGVTTIIQRSIEHCEKLLDV